MERQQGLINGRGPNNQVYNYYKLYLVSDNRVT